MWNLKTPSKKTIRELYDKYAIATVNGTSALHLSFIVNGVAQNDEVICPDITFVATAAAIVYTGAKPIFLDIEDDSFGLCPEKLELFLKLLIFPCSLTALS